MLSVGEFKVLSFVVFLVLLSGCAPEQQNVEHIKKLRYQEGYAQGVRDGEQKGYDKTCTEAFYRVYPGTAHQHSGVLGGIQKIFAILGACKIIISLAILIGYLLHRSRNSEKEFAGNMLMGVLGSIVVIWSASAFSIADKLNDFLLFPSSETVWGWLFFGSISASLTYIIFRLVDAFLHAMQGARIEAWSIFTASALVTILIPSLISFFKDVPDINNYFASELLVGVLIGGVYFIADRLLRSPA